MRAGVFGLVLAGLLAAAIPAVAAEKTVERVGGFIIIAIEEKGRFDRCAAQIGSSYGMLRISYNIHGNHFLSFPGVPGASKSGTVELMIAGEVLDTSRPNFADKNRISIPLSYEQVDMLMAARGNLSVLYNNANFREWDLSRSNVTAALEAVDRCVNKFR
jgi:hypothetical protein